MPVCQYASMPVCQCHHGQLSVFYASNPFFYYSVRSELNWPVGPKEPLDFTVGVVQQGRKGESGLRWKIASHLLDLFFCWRQRSLNGAGAYAESLEAQNVLDELSVLLNAACKEKIHVSTSPHLILLDRGWYAKHVVPLVVRWMLLW